MSIVHREPSVAWSPHLVGTTVVNLFPSTLTAGVAIPGVGHAANRVHVAADYTVASGTMSLTVGVYGLTTPLSAGGTAGTFLGTSTWVYLGSLNAGSSIAADTSRWSVSATRITLAEVFSVSGENYQRIATGCGPPGGTTPVVSTYIGFCVE